MNQSPVSTGANPQRSWLVLAILLSWQLMVVLDATIVNIALPDIRTDLNFSETGLSWVVNAYALTFGGLLLLGGRAGDILGRRRVLVWGVIIFTIASALGGIAPNPETMILARILQGLDAAIAAPSTISLIITNFREESTRNRALSLVAVVAGIGGSIGLIVGGLLTSAFSWHWVFFINLPIGIAVAAMAPRWVMESERHQGAFDLIGALTSTTAVTALVYGFIRASEEGWSDGYTLASFAVSVVFLAIFLFNETRVQQPILPLHLLSYRPRAVALTTMLLLPSAMFGLFFFLSQYMQVVLGFDALQTGFAFLPLTAGIISAARISQITVPRFGIRAQLSAAALLLSGALIWLSRVEVDSNYWLNLLPALLFIGFAGGSSFPPISIVVMSNLHPADSGSASGLLQTVQQVGGAIGLALLVTVFGTVNRNALEAGEQPLVAMTDGMSRGFLTAAAIAGLYFLVAFFGFRKSGAPPPVTDAVSMPVAAD